jgi:hypothetical protein
MEKLDHSVLKYVFERGPDVFLPTKHHGFHNAQSCNLVWASAGAVQTLSSLLSHSGSYPMPTIDGATTAPALGPYS